MGACKCGAEGSSGELVRDGILLDVQSVCDACWAPFLEGLEYWRGQFNALLDKGVARDEANRQIIGRLNAGEQAC